MEGMKVSGDLVLVEGVRSALRRRGVSPVFSVDWLKQGST